MDVAEIRAKIKEVISNVTNIDPESNTVYVGPREALEATCLQAEDVRLLGSLDVDQKVDAKIRSQMDPQPARVVSLSPEALTVEFDRPQFAITPGQSAVLYVQDRVVAGGIIARGHMLASTKGFPV